METEPNLSIFSTGVVVSTLPIRNGNVFLEDLAVINTNVSTLPIRNGNIAITADAAPRKV